MAACDSTLFSHSRISTTKEGESSPRSLATPKFRSSRSHYFQSRAFMYHQPRPLKPDRTKLSPKRHACRDVTYRQCSTATVCLLREARSNRIDFSIAGCASRGVGRLWARQRGWRATELNVGRYLRHIPTSLRANIQTHALCQLDFSDRLRRHLMRSA